jgi:argininosuccinate lyase
MFAVNEFKLQIQDLKMSVNKWETDEFPAKINEAQNAIVTNVETQLVDKVVAEMGKLDAKFSRNFNHHTSLQSQLFDRINAQETVIINHIN